MDITVRKTIIHQLRQGTVPEVGHEAFAVGTENTMAEIQRNLNFAAEGNGAVKFLRGNFGCGKTFISRYTLAVAKEQNFVTSFVVVSPNETRFHIFQDVYNKICQNLQTMNAKSTGVLADALDRWFGTIEEDLLKRDNLNYDDPEFDSKMEKRFEVELTDLLKEDASQDFLAVIRAYFRAKQNGDIENAGQLLSWLSGSPNVNADAKRKAGIKGEISSQAALTYLKGLVSIFRRAGYRGLAIVTDEMETILRERRDVREKSMNGLRQITDAIEGYKGLLWIFTGTIEFFDSHKGVAGLKPLYDRIEFKKVGEFVSLKQPQIELKPMKDDRLYEISLRLRDIYPAEAKESFYVRMNDEFLQKFAKKHTEGFAGEIGVVPRKFLRDLINCMDLVCENEKFNPEKEFQLESARPEDMPQVLNVAEAENEAPYSEVTF